MYWVSEIIEIGEPFPTQKRDLLIAQSQEEHVVHRAGDAISTVHQRRFATFEALQGAAKSFS